MRKKILQIGSSLGVTINRDTLKRLGLKKGSQVEVAFNSRRRAIEIKPRDAASAKSSDLLNTVRELSQRHAAELSAVDDD